MATLIAEDFLTHLRTRIGRKLDGVRTTETIWFGTPTNIRRIRMIYTNEEWRFSMDRFTVKTFESTAYVDAITIVDCPIVAAHSAINYVWKELEGMNGQELPFFADCATMKLLLDSNKVQSVIFDAIVPPMVRLTQPHLVSPTGGSVLDVIEVLSATKVIDVLAALKTGLVCYAIVGALPTAIRLELANEGCNIFQDVVNRMHHFVQPQFK